MRCKLDKIDVFYESYGEGRPLVALHGFSLDHQVMKGCLEPVFNRRPGWRRVYLDLPGMGRTTGEEWIANSDDILDVVLEFLETLIPDQQIALAGQSYGGYLARAVIQRKREIVDGLLLICPMTIADRTKRTLPDHKVISSNMEFLSSLKQEDMENARAYFESSHVVLNRKVWSRFRKEVFVGLKAADYSFLERLLAGGYEFSFDLEAYNETYDKPALLITGRQDTSAGYHDAWSIIRNYPRMTFAVLDRAGHDLQIEQAELFNALVNEWLDRVEEQVNKH